MKKLLLLIALLLVTAVSCAEPTCAELTVDYRAAVDDIDARFVDAFDLASSTARMSLSEPISQMQEINRDAKGLEVPECAETAHDALIRYQEAAINAFLAFLSQADDDEVTTLFERTAERQVTWFIEYGRLTEDENN